MGKGRRRWIRNLLTADDEDDIPGRMRVERGMIKTFGVHNNGVSSEIGRREGVRGESREKETGATRVPSGMGGQGPERGGCHWATLGR